MKLILSTFFFLLLFSVVIGQVSFRTEYDSINPINKEDEFSLERKIEIHSGFLNSGLKNKDRTTQFFGYLFLLSDYMRDQDYVNANTYLVKADSVANLTNNKKWQGHIWHRKAILALRLDKLEDAKNAYISSLPLCGEGKDSLCVAEAYEQLSTIYGHLGDFETSRLYHNKAMPLILRYGSKKQLATMYNNYAILSVKKDRIEEGIAKYKESIEIYKELKMTKDMTKVLNNLADAYRNQGDFKEALVILDKVVSINKKENLKENLYVNYLNLSAVFDSLGQYEKSLRYYIKYHELRDSLLGQETQDKIAEFNIKYDTQIKELELAKYELALQESRNENVRKTLLILGILSALFLTIYLGYKNYKKNKTALLKSTKEAQQLYGDKVKDIAKINELEEVILDFKARIHDTHEGLLKNAKEVNSTTILTSDDWVAFKDYFYKLHPGYINRLRETYPLLSESEERLFILIKLNYLTKEIAAILGINKDSVKKTRLRLRKKLELEKVVNLEDFVREF